MSDLADPVKLVLDVPLPQRHRVTLLGVPAPDPRYTVVVGCYEFNIAALRYHNHTDDPGLDWVEATLL